MSGQERAKAQREDYRYFLDIPTRWMDNDIYGHVNNVVYYSYFDTVINRFLIDEAGLDIHNGSVIGIAVESMCRFHASFAYPETIAAALRVARIGTSSVRYELALFPMDGIEPSAEGYFVHVFVGRHGGRPMAIPPAIRSALERLEI